MFWFYQQPGPDLNCNPHRRGSTTLHATCFAGGPLQSSLHITWWYSKSTADGSDPLSPPERVTGPSFRVAETRANNSLSTLLSSTLSLQVREIEREAQEGVCVWCQIEATGRTLVDSASNRFCVRRPRAYVSLPSCESHEVVPHTFNRVCVEELGVVQVPKSSETPRQTLSGTAVASVVVFLATKVSFEPTKSFTVAAEISSSSDGSSATTSMLETTHRHNVPGHLSDMRALPSKTAIVAPYTSIDTPSAYIDVQAGPGSISSSSTVLSMQHRPTIPLLPTPTGTGGGDHLPPGSALSRESITVLYSAVVVCVLLAAVVLVLVVVVLLMCRRHREMVRRRSADKVTKSSNFLPRACGHYRSQLSLSGQLH